MYLEYFKLDYTLTWQTIVYISFNQYPLHRGAMDGRISVIHTYTHTHTYKHMYTCIYIYTE